MVHLPFCTSLRADGQSAETEGYEGDSQTQAICALSSQSFQATIGSYPHRSPERTSREQWQSDLGPLQSGVAVEGLGALVSSPLA